MIKFLKNKTLTVLIFFFIFSPFVLAETPASVATYDQLVQAIRKTRPENPTVLTTVWRLSL